jgi:hypothetical protein
MPAFLAAPSLRTSVPDGFDAWVITMVLAEPSFHSNQSLAVNSAVILQTYTSSEHCFSMHLSKIGPSVGAQSYLLQ